MWVLKTSLIATIHSWINTMVKLINCLVDFLYFSNLISQCCFKTLPRQSWSRSSSIFFFVAKFFNKMLLEKDISCKMLSYFHRI